MSGWSAVPLGEVCAINPRLARSERPEDEATVSFVPMAVVDEVDGAIVAAEARPYRSVAKGYTAFQEGDVLFAKITPCMENGKAAVARNLIGGFGFGSTEFHVLRPGPRLDREYLFHWIRRPEFRRQAKAHFTGTAGQQRVPTSFLESVTLPLPPLEEQRRIVDILDRAVSIRRLRRQAQETARQIVPALFNRMFGEPETNPKGLPVFPLGKILADSPQNGLYRPASDYGRGTRILRIDSFYDGQVSDLRALRRVELDSATVKKYLLRPGDIVVNRVNSRPYLGKSAILPAMEEPVVFESNMMRLIVNPEQAKPEYVIAYLQTPYARRRLVANAKDAINQSSINQQDVCGLPVPIPSQSAQAEFVERAATLARIGERQTIAERIAEQTVQALQARLFDA